MSRIRAASAQKPEFAPGARYDAKIPSLKQVTGFDFAERVTPPEEIIRYLKALHEAAPDRTKLVKYAETWEKRELYALIVATPDRIRQLDQIKSGLKQLANPAASTDVARLSRELPVVVALIHGVQIEKISWGVTLIIAAMIVNGLIGLYLIRSGRKHGSIALVADGKHLLSDAVTSAAVLVALLIILLHPEWIYVDPIAALRCE